MNRGFFFLHDDQICEYSQNLVQKLKNENYKINAIIDVKLQM